MSERSKLTGVSLANSGWILKMKPIVPTRYKMVNMVTAVFSEREYSYIVEVTGCEEADICCIVMDLKVVEMTQK